MDLTQRTRSNLSELENLSDSDWLDIASNRASEDDDSVAGFDSDREDADGRPFSRHSFSSLASSSDEVVEGWEGLIDDSADETALTSVEHLADVRLTADSVQRDLASSPEGEDDHEDERVKAALDQSMMSTLSSSRSNSLANSVQASIVHSTRSLRLSFPDPTTSRLESLNSSFEELPPSDADHFTSDDGKLPSTSAVTTADPLRVPTPEPAVSVIVKHDTVSAFALPTNPSFSVVLYGTSLASKMAFVDTLLQKWARGSNFVTSEKSAVDSRIVFHTFKSSLLINDEGSFRRVVSVIDNTGHDQSQLTTHTKCPSLAVVFLPCISEISIPEHTLYLPVMMAAPLSPIDILGSTDYLLEAEQQWEAQSIPPSKLTELSRRSSPVVDEALIERASDEQIERALRTLSPCTMKKTAPKVSAHAITIMAILSIVLGYIINGIADTPDTRSFVASAVTTPLMNLLRPMPMAANKSISTSLLSIASSGSAVSLSSLKDFQVAVFNPSVVSTDVITSHHAKDTQPTASASTPVAATTPTVEHGPAECDCGCGLLTWPARTETTDLMLRPTASSLSVLTKPVNSVSVIPSHTPIVGKGKGKASDLDNSLYALSTRMATSLSEYFGFSPMVQAVVTDLQELIVALDQLAHIITRQTAAVWEQSKGVLSVTRDELKHRNNRAKTRAQQLRKAGGMWISSLKDRFKCRAETAQENARALRRRVSARRAERRRLRQAKKLERREVRAIKAAQAAGN